MMSTRIMSLPFISPSSPPPIDSDQLTDGDEDFGHYVGQEDTFDITGLSQKFSTTEKENDVSLRTTSACTLLESISNVCIQNTDIGKSNLNEFPVYSESSECTSAASEPLSLATPPPLDCVGTFLETNYSEESSVYQNYTNESEDEFGEFVIGQDNIEVPVVINCIESNNEILFHNKPQSCQDIITDCQGVNDLVKSSKSPVNYKEILSNQAHTNVDNSLKEFPETADCVLTNNKDIFIIDNCNTTEISCSEITTTRPSGSVTTTNNSSENLEAITCTSPCKNEDEKDIKICPERLDESISFNEFKIYNSSKVTNSVSSNKVEPSTKVLGDVITQCSSGSNENEIHVYLEDDISEFGDFADFETSKNEPVIQHDFDNDFSDVSEEENSELEKELRNKIDLAINDDDDDDEFGEFNSNIGFCEEKRFCKNEFSWTQSAGEEMVSLHSSKVYCKEIGDDRANQFDTFILKWVPLEPCFNEDSIGRKILQKLDEVLEGDAFIWHHLEDIDSCLALKLVWPSTQANKLFLNSLNVDARNIVSKDSMLFGHKWSSSVPLFAQTLSFSPLTPAKPTEAPVTLANTWSIIEDKKAISKSTEASTKSTWNESSGSISKLEILCEPTLKSNVTSRTEKDAKDKENEGIIPPAQFDWSSSGLTNPLDAQGLEKEILSNSPLPVLKNENDLNHTSFNMLDKLMKGKELAKTTSFESLPLKVKNVVKDLPDLNYMKCKVLMFPIRGETNS